MQQLYPDEGLVMQMERILTAGVRLHLFTNDITPDRDTVLADLTEAAWSGYVMIELDDTDFGTTGVAAHQGYMMANPQSFLNSSGVDQDAFGYYYTEQNARHQR